MTCEMVEHQVDVYFDRELSAESSAVVRSHLHACTSVAPAWPSFRSWPGSSEPRPFTLPRIACGHECWNALVVQLPESFPVNGGAEHNWSLQDHESSKSGHP